MHTVRKKFKITDGDLFLCDMRPGFSEDGVFCELPTGEYKITIEPTAKNLRGFMLIRVGANPSSAIRHGTFSLDMARIGIFEKKKFLGAVNGDAEELYEWSEAASDESTSICGFIKHSPSRHEALFVDVGSDCTCVVDILKSGKQTVGIRVIPSVQAPQPPPEVGARYWTWVRIKIGGIREPWEFCDDRDFKPVLSEVLDDVISEVACVARADELIFQNSDQIDPRLPILKYQPNFRGIDKITVLSERAGEKQRKLEVPAKYEIPQLPLGVTNAQLAAAVYKIFKDARRWE